MASDEVYPCDDDFYRVTTRLSNAIEKYEGLLKAISLPNPTLRPEEHVDKEVIQSIKTEISNTCARLRALTISPEDQMKLICFRVANAPPWARRNVSKRVQSGLTAAIQIAYDLNIFNMVPVNGGMTALQIAYHTGAEELFIGRFWDTRLKQSFTRPAEAQHLPRISQIYASVDKPLSIPRDLASHICPLAVLHHHEESPGR